MTQISKVAPRPAGDKDKAVKQRLYVGGLVPNVTAIELGQRFESFGVVESVDIIHKQGSCQDCRGFAFVNMVISENMLTRCTGIYNKSKWKGMQLKIQVAKASFMDKLAREKRDREDVLTAVSNDITPSPPASVELVNDDNMDGKEGWKRRRYGRAVCVMKMKKPGSYRISNLDPSKFKMGLTIIEESLPNKSITQLSWPVEASSTSDDDNVDSEQQENESLHSEAEEANEMAVEKEVHEEEEVELQAHQSAEFDQHSASIPANHDHQEEQEQQIQQQQKQEEEEVVDKEEEQVPLKIGDSTLSSKVQVNTDLKSLINQDDSVPGGGSFSLFGFGESANDDDKSSDDDGNTSGGGDVNDTTTNEDSDAASNASENPMHIDQKRSSNTDATSSEDSPLLLDTFSTTKMFFMHPTNEALKSRSIFFTSNSSSATTTASPTTVLFKRDATEEEIYKKWEAEKGELTNDFKRKSRAARKKSKKIQRSSSRFQ